MKEDFLILVRKIFPNATSESIKLHKTLTELDFCWCYGEVSVYNYPDEYRNLIFEINERARQEVKAK
jgi:hypothetical protein